MPTSTLRPASGTTRTTTAVADTQSQRLVAAVSDRPLWVVGLGCQRGCSAPELRQLMEDGLRECRLEPGDIAALASIDGKSDEAGLLELGHALGLPLGFFRAGDLAAYDNQLSHRSEIAFGRTGCYGVAESAALAMATRLTGSPATLVVPRQKSPHATFALATANVRAGAIL